MNTEQPGSKSDERTDANAAFDALLALNDVTVLPDRRAAVVAAVGELRRQARQLRDDVGTEPYARDDSRKV